MAGPLLRKNRIDRNQHAINRVDDAVGALSQVTPRPPYLVVCCKNSHNNTF
jgi:hypothetical protein